MFICAVLPEDKHILYYNLMEGYEKVSALAIYGTNLPTSQVSEGIGVLAMPRVLVSAHGGPVLFQFRQHWVLLFSMAPHKFITVFRR
ncbi:hypothetical protein AOV_00555 [Anaplasma ovis str. Haibei]|uniref:Uncharacterized protein n=1 Tax=Anaplasma ovis str. Haibei TaxID=1248439 RepID=A0A2Z2LG09_9RICK|nr:hypothetical protein AOV_00555 [Anaplasma ovis str. Haibei]